tara:strand:- start:189 stop:434 length:246 start_codon:yes stop_codon:yes gene_type:complete
MPYKIVTTIREQSQDRFYDVIDMKLSRSKKVIKLFMEEDMAEHYARKELKKEENEFKIIEVETAYDYETTSTEPSTSTDED